MDCLLIKCSLPKFSLLWSGHGQYINTQLFHVKELDQRTLEVNFQFQKAKCQPSLICI